MRSMRRFGCSVETLVIVALALLTFSCTGGSSPSSTPDPPSSVAPDPPSSVTPDPPHGTARPTARPSPSPAPTPTQTTAAYYVNGSTGGDGNPGTASAPFATLAKCQSTMEGSSTKTCIVDSGTYTLSGDWTFGSSDAGETWEAACGQLVTIDGNGSYSIAANGATGLTFYGFTFEDLAADGGFDINLTGSGYTFRWNTILNCTDSCLGGSGVESSLIDSNTINGQSPGNVNGSISDYWGSLEFYNGSAGNTISHNLIENTQGGGVDFNNGSGEPAQSNNIMSYNLLENVDEDCQDCGALYLYDANNAGTGNKIEYNDVFGNGIGYNSDKCIYLDNGASNMTITGNICADSSYSNTDYCLNSGATGCNYISGEYDIFFHTGGNNTVTYNILESHSTSTYTDVWGNSSNGTYLGSTQDSTGGNTFSNNIVFSPGSWPNPLWYLQGGPDPSSSDNDYWSATGATSNAGIADSGSDNADPDFANPSANNYAVGSSSIAWIALPTSQGPVVNTVCPNGY
jgi:hypothetical protein